MVAMWMGGGLDLVEEAVSDSDRGPPSLRVWFVCAFRPAIPVPIGHDRAGGARGVVGRQGGSQDRSRQGPPE